MKLLLIVILLLGYSSDLFALMPLRLRHSGVLICARQTMCTVCGKPAEAPYLSSLLTTAPSLHHRFFFPGHGGVAPPGMRELCDVQSLYAHDVPELDGTDNIHSPEGPLLHSLQLAAKLFGARRTWFLVNGSSSGIMMAILSCVRLHQMQQQRNSRNQLVVQPTDRTTHTDDPSPESTPRSIFIVGRDAHKSVFDALSLTQGCDAVLLPCALDSTFQVSLGVTLDSIQQAIDTHGSKICGLLLTRPSYQGLMLNTQDMQAVVKLCHQHGIPVVVDEAHGAHLRFLNSPIYQDALSCGADVVVQSAHKTLTSLSQTAMLHLGTNSFQYHVPKTHLHELSSRPAASSTAPTDSGVYNVNDGTQLEAPSELPHPDRSARSAGKAIEVSLVESTVHSYFSMLTTTSPNSVLLASLDASRAQFEEHGAQMVQQTALAVNRLRHSLRSQGAPFINLLEDSPDVRKRGLVVDPLRLSVRFDTGSLATDATNRDSTHFDDMLCDEHGIYCELNQRQCITYAIPPASCCDSGAVSAEKAPTANTVHTRVAAAGSQQSSLLCLEFSLLELADTFRLQHQRHQSSAATISTTPTEGIHGAGTLLDMQFSQHQQSLGYLHCSGGHLLTCAVPVDGNDQLVGRISAETISVYPPGIPILAKGEVIQRSHIQALVHLHRALAAHNRVVGGLPSGTTVTGCASATLDTILVYE